MIKLIDRMLGFVSLIGASMFAIPLSVLLLGSSFEGAAIIIPVLSLAFSFFGFFLQNLNAKLQNKRASEDGFSSLKDGVLEGFKPIYSAIPIALLIILSVPILLIYDKSMQMLFAKGIMDRYDFIYTVFFAIIYLFSSITGVVIWFYPVQRLSNIYVLLAGASIFYVETFFVVLNKSMYSSTVIALPLIVFTVCILLIFNQSNLQRQYRGSVVSVMTPSSRLYNVFLVFVLFLMFLAVAYIVYVLLSGLWIILKSILYIILFRIFHTTTTNGSDEYEYVDSDEARSKFERDVVSNENANLLGVFIFIVAVFAFVYIGIRKGFLIKFFNKIREWIREVISTYLIGREIFKNSFDPNEEDEFLNYKDEKKKIQNAAIRDYDSMAEATDDYKTFIRELGKLHDYNEQLCYAYSVLLKIYKKKSIAIKISDTPREVKGKVERSVNEGVIAEITSDFEQLRYAEKDVTDSEAAEILENICAEIKRYMY